MYTRDQDLVEMYSVSAETMIKMHFHIKKMHKDKEVKEIIIIVTDPCIANQLRDVYTICRRSWYIAAHIWKIYDFKIEVVPFIIISSSIKFEQLKQKSFSPFYINIAASLLS
jgi:hypothetical protein